MTDSRPRLRFAYWSDPLCIWAYVAQDKLTRIMEEWGDQLDVDHHVVPVFGSLPWRFTQGPWAKGGPAARVAATRKVAADNGHPEVTGEVWTKISPSSSWAPGAAIKAVFAMEAAGDLSPGTAAAYQWALRVRFFVDEQNVCCRPVQLAVAEELDIPRAGIEARLDDGTALAALWEDHNAKEEQRIPGSPTYIFDGGRARLYGNFAWGVLHATVEELLRGLEPGCSDC